MTTIKPIAGASAGEASHLTIQPFISTEVLTALRNGSGNLELIGWHIESDKIVRGADSGTQAGTAQEVALTLMARARHAITAVRSGSGRLLLISWDVPFGLKTIRRLADTGSAAGEASQIAMTALGTAMLVTALRAGNGNLLLISWGLASDGTMTRLGDSNPAGQPPQAGEVSLVTIAPLGSNTVVTAVRNGRGNLELIAWNVSSDGKHIRRQGDSGNQAGAVGEIAIYPTRDDLAGPGVLTAVRNGSGNLELIPWKVLDGGLGGVVRTGKGIEAGTASHIAISPAGTPPTYVASMRRGSGDIELIAFQLGGNGAIARTGDFGQREGTDVTETAIASLGGPAVTATRQANFLNVITWSVT